MTTPKTSRKKTTQHPEIVRRLAERMATDEQTAAHWMDAVAESLHEAVSLGESPTLPKFGSFYVRPERDCWVFKFNPSQRLRATLGWSSTYKPKP